MLFDLSYSFRLLKQPQIILHTRCNISCALTHENNITRVFTSLVLANLKSFLRSSIVRNVSQFHEVMWLVLIF